MSPEFIAIIIFGTVQLSGLLILGWILRDISVATRIHVLQGRRIEEVLRELVQRGA
jgi:hypothetical protein